MFCITLRRRGIHTAPILVSLMLCATASSMPPEVWFSPGVSYDAAEPEPKVVIAAYIDDDMHLDLVITSAGNDSNPGGVTVLLGDGLGGFGNDAPFSSGVQPYGLASADFDRDGHADLAVTQGGHDSSAVKIWMGDGSGGFVLGATLTAGKFPLAAAAGDFNHDSKPDLAVANNVLYGVTIFIGNGDGTFGAAQHLPGQAGLAATDISAGLINADSHLDLVVSHYSGESIFLGDGSGGFTYAGGAGSSLIHEANDLGDIDGDGLLDLAAIEFYGERLLVCYGNGDGTFGPPEAHDIGFRCEDVRIADLNGDSHAEVLVSHQGLGVLLFLNSGCGDLFPPQTVATGTQNTCLVTGDFDEDGLPDLAGVCRNYGDTPYATIRLQYPPPPTLPGDFDGDGHVGLSDLSRLLSSFGLCHGDSMFDAYTDLDNDCCVGLADLSSLLEWYGV